MSTSLISRLVDNKVLILHYCTLIIVSTICDYIISSEYQSKSKRLWIIIGTDSFCHALTAGILWSSVELPNVLENNTVDTLSWNLLQMKDFTSYVIHSLVATFIGISLDLDHFVAALSWRLADARNLPRRPFGHSLLFIFLVSSSVYYFSSKSLLYTSLVAIVLLSHQLRDSEKRGLWMWPFGSTPKFSVVMVYSLDILLSLILRKLLYGKSLVYRNIVGSRGYYSPVNV
jgi:membrane-bound metal-dependent hydrolase YbcI (DUF457 family)